MANLQVPLPPLQGPSGREAQERANEAKSGDLETVLT
jgi:hypothetical protein